MRARSILLLPALLLCLVGCRGGISSSPPGTRATGFQGKSRRISSPSGWPDGRGQRMPVENTVARQAARLPDMSCCRPTTRKEVDGSYMVQNPVSVESGAGAGRERSTSPVPCATVLRPRWLGPGRRHVGKRWAAADDPDFQQYRGDPPQRVPGALGRRLFEVITSKNNDARYRAQSPSRSLAIIISGACSASDSARDDEP